MRTSTENEGNQLVLRIEGELDALSVPDIRPIIDRLVADDHPKILVDISGLRLIDSSGVGSIVSLYKRCRARGCPVVVRGATEQPLAIFRLLRLDTVLFG